MIVKPSMSHEPVASVLLLCPFGPSCVFWEDPIRSAFLLMYVNKPAGMKGYLKHLT